VLRPRGEAGPRRHKRLRQSQRKLWRKLTAVFRPSDLGSSCIFSWSLVTSFFLYDKVEVLVLVLWLLVSGGVISDIHSWKQSGSSGKA
jgi:hypothetical protein